MNEYLFSPGPTPIEETIKINFSHRDKEFEKLLQRIKTQLLFLAPYYKDVIFTQGSASSAIETVLSSVVGEKDTILMLSNGSFGKRAKEMAEHYCSNVIVKSTIEECKEEIEKVEITHFFAVQFETSLSIFNSLWDIINTCKEKKIVSIVDAVSAFPYYFDCVPDFLITSSAKQLNGLPALGLIFYKERKDIVLYERSDYLNLKKYIHYSEKNQTPHTSLIPQFISLDKSLSTFEAVKNAVRIKKNSDALTKDIESMFLNTTCAPVLTVKVKNLEKVIDVLHCLDIKVYYNLFYMKDYIQVSTFNYYTTEPYVKLNQILKFLNNE